MGFLWGLSLPNLLLLFLLSSSPCHQLPRLLLLLSSSHHQPRHSNQKKTIPRPLTGLERRYPHHLPSGSSPPLGMMHLGVLASSAIQLSSSRTKGTSTCGPL